MSQASYLRAVPSIREMRERYLSRLTTPIEVVTDRLDRIHKLDEILQCWVVVDAERALESARHQTRMLERNEPLPPLFGITLGVKDIIDVAGLATMSGVEEPDCEVAAQDADVVAQLRAAGAIVLGKTVTTPFACFDPPRTKNPWGTAHTPGGSSSGSAAAVAAGMVDIALGTQTGGSIIRPASFCGISGWKPSWGTYSMDGIVPVSKRLDHVGPLAQRVESLLAVRAIMSQAATANESPGKSDSTERIPAGLDSAAGLYKDREYEDGEYKDGEYEDGEHEDGEHEDGEANDSEAEIRSRAPQTISILRELVEEGVELELVNRVAIQLDSAPELNVRVEFERLPFDLNEALDAHRTIMCHDVARVHQLRFERNPASLPEGIRSLIDEGFLVTDEAYTAACNTQQWCTRLLEAWMYDGRVLLSPAAMGAAPRSLQTTGNPRYNSLFSLTGVPALTVSFGKDPSGMPLGIQLASHVSRESTLFDLAVALQQMYMSLLNQGKA